MKLLITGGNGFIGSHLAEKLIEKEHSVSLFDLIFTSNSKGLDCKRITGDVTDYDSILKAVKGMDAVFHFAAISHVILGQQNPLKCWKTNVLGTMNVLEACRFSEKNPVIFFSSSREVYGESQYLPVDETHPKMPKSIYGMSKLCAEKACCSYLDNYGLNSVIFRFANVYGSQRDQPDRVIPKFMYKAIRNEDIVLYGGEQILDFTFIDDTVSGILKAFELAFSDSIKILNEDFNFATGRGTSISNLAKMIVESCGSSSRILKIKSKDFDVCAFYGDITKSKRILRYKPKVKIEEGLKMLKRRILLK